MRYGRKKPYTERGIRRLQFARCGEPAEFQWSIFADGNLQRPICAKCDVALNAMVLRWIGDPGAKEKIKKYSAEKFRREA